MPTPDYAPLDPERLAVLLMEKAMANEHRVLSRLIIGLLDLHEVLAVRTDGRWVSASSRGGDFAYLQGARFGVAIFDRLTTKGSALAIAEEITELRRMDRPVLVFVDSGLDLSAGGIFWPISEVLGDRDFVTFDFEHPGLTVPADLQRWLRTEELL